MAWQDHLDRAAELLDEAHLGGTQQLSPSGCALMASAHIQLWHAERIRKFEQAQEKWARRQRENTPPLPPVMPHPGYVGF